MRLNRIACSLLLLIVATRASAQDASTSDRSVARSLFHEGVACLDARDIPCAADRFRRSLELYPSPVVAYNLASAEERLGHIAVAAELFVGVAGDESASEDVRDAARAKHRDLWPRVAFVIVRSDDLHGAELSIDGSAFPEQALGVRTSIDPGSHSLQATRDGAVIAERTFEATSGQAAEVALQIPAPAIEPRVAVPPVLPPREITPSPQPPLTHTPPDEVSHRGRRVALVLTALAVVGGGVALAVVLSRDGAPNAIDGTAGTWEIGR